MTAENPEVVNNTEERRFEIALGDTVAFLAYDIEGSRIIFQHTQVPQEFSGGGIGGRLVKAALEHAKEQGLKVVPRCPYTAAYITRHPEYEAITIRE